MSGPDRPSVLIVSNGRGEDAVGAALARAMADSSVIAYPLVGLGDAYARLEVLEPRAALPSGGFSLRRVRSLGADIRAGGLALWRAQRRTLAAQRGRHRVTVAIGDVYCLRMAAASRTPVLFVATAKSEYSEPHRWLERRVVRRYAAVTFTRDEPTAVALRARGLRARFHGNPLMDTIPPAERPLGVGSPAVLLLPGSREDAIRNLLHLLNVVVNAAPKVAAAFVCALAPTTPLAALARLTAAAGWSLEQSQLRREEVSVFLTSSFGSALAVGTVAVGTAGTANEQAAGRGIPVVAFPPPGALQFTPAFLRLQSRLLGEALIATDRWESAVDALVHLLENPDERVRRGAIGRERMDGGGAVAAIAAEVRALVGV